jgi:hypothetical protein
LPWNDDIQSNELRNEGGESWSVAPREFVVAVSKESELRNGVFLKDNGSRVYNEKVSAP